MNLMTLIFTIIGFTVGAIIGYIIKLIIKNRWFKKVKNVVNFFIVATLAIVWVLYGFMIWSILHNHFITQAMIKYPECFPKNFTEVTVMCDLIDWPSTLFLMQQIFMFIILTKEMIECQS